jgi:hypothetical protein
VDLLNDSDNWVKIQAFKAVSKLINRNEGRSDCHPTDLITEQQMKEDVFPALVKLLEIIPDDAESTTKLMQEFGKILYSISRRFKNLVSDHATVICKFFRLCCQSKESQTREHAAFNFSCFFDLFGHLQD